MREIGRVTNKKLIGFELGAAPPVQIRNDTAFNIFRNPQDAACRNLVTHTVALVTPIVYNVT